MITATTRVLARILATIAALAISFSILIAAPTTATSEPSPCTKVWLTAPSYFGKFQSGQSRCIWPWDKVNGWTRIYSWNDRSKDVIDYTFMWTTTPPNDGRVQSTADAALWVAKKYGAHLQFANRDYLGRLGCASPFPNSVSGAYAGTGQYPGQGLIRIGTGTTDRCMNDRRTVLNVVKHEISHALIERRCGTTRPRMVYRPESGFNRIEETTTAYAMKFLGATTNAGGLVPATKDYWRATEIYYGRCG